MVRSYVAPQDLAHLYCIHHNLLQVICSHFFFPVQICEFFKGRNRVLIILVSLHKVDTHLVFTKLS